MLASSNQEIITLQLNVFQGIDYAVKSKAKTRFLVLYFIVRDDLSSSHLCHIHH